MHYLKGKALIDKGEGYSRPGISFISMRDSFVDMLSNKYAGSMGKDKEMEV